MTSEPPMRNWTEIEDQISRSALAAGDPTGWFDTLYAKGAAGEVTMPWGRAEPHPLLVEWTAGRDLSGVRRAAVVGCGLGADAEYLSTRGPASVTAFDVAPTAIEIAQARHPASTVDYRVADLLHLPAGWRGSFDLVVEIITVQALPFEVRANAISGVRSLVSSAGTLLVVALESAGDETGPPWPLSRHDVDSFARNGLEAVSVRVQPGTEPGVARWVAEFVRA